MPKIEYKSIKFQQKSLELINLVNQVVEEYQAQGYELTLRQAYYQLVARGYIPNNERSYKNIGNLITDSRASKYIDEYGNESWELDALEPQVITDLITNEVTALRNDEIYRSICDLEERGKDELRMIERNYDKAVAFLESEE